MDQNKIEKDAKDMLDKFARALEKIDKIKDVDFYVERKEFERIEKSGRDYEKGFKDMILKNAPEHDDEFIVAETGDWK